MAFHFGSPNASAFGNAGAGSTNTQIGPELEEIQTEALGFQSLAGEAKLRLVPSWPAEALPPSTASLLSIASQKGLLAAAGPDAVIIASTEAVRKAFADKDAGDGNIRPFTPQLTLKLGMRISQVAFSADESFLVLSAERGGGLAVYEVQSLIQGNTESAFQIATNGVALRMLLPNPTPERAELFAAVTVDGNLLIANLAARQFTSGAQGMTMKSGVSCVSWSARGKQLVAGLGNGTCYQMTPEGVGKAEIPTPPDIEGDQHVSAISWLENDVFLAAHTTSTQDEGLIPATTFRVISRQASPQTSYTYQKLPDPAPPFGMNRSQPYQFIQRLRNFPPNLSDVLVVASSASTDVGLLTRAETALSSDVDQAKITKVFTTTTMANDTRRAQLPMAEDLSDTSPIGMALDLSATEKVPRPLPNEEMDESNGPLPALMILNNEGLLATWWIVYAESIRQGTTYPGLTVAGPSQTQEQSTKSASPFASSAAQNTSAPFASNAFGTAPAQQNSFPSSSTPAFGNNSGSNNAFGASSALGSKPSPWGTGAATSISPQTAGATFGKPTFGSSTPFGAATGGAAFGAAGGLGNRPSPWGAPSAGTQNTGTAFGQTASSGMGAGSTFGNSNANTASNTQQPVSGFASFAQGPGFAAAAVKQSGGESPFAKAGQGTSFGSGMEIGSDFGGTPKKSEVAPTSLFGGGGFAGSFKLGSTFKGDGTSSSDGPKPTITDNNSLFGGEFTSKLGETQEQPLAPESKEADMTEDGNVSEQEVMSEASQNDETSATPVAKPRQSLFGFQQTTPPTTGGLFGTQAQSKTTPAMVQNNAPASSPATEPVPVSTTPEDTPKKPEDTARPSIENAPVPIKPEPEDESFSSVSEAVPETGAKGPLPPDPTSKDSYSPGDTSQSSASGSKAANDDAPLPPDFLPSGPKLKKAEAKPEEEPPLPEGDFSASDDEGSGVDVAKEISSNTDPAQTSKINPGSPFGANLDKSPEGLFSSRGPPDAQSKSKSLFGDVGKSSAFHFPRPSKTQESPRSPSPVRLAQLATDGLRPDNARSISAPHGNIGASLGRKQSGHTPNIRIADPQPSIEELRKREQQRLNELRAQQQEEERQVLDDREDEEIRKLLETEVEPTTMLEDFIAHEDYNEEESKPGLPGQIEKVYRDINSMVDTVGLNARNLEAFTLGHTELCKQDGRSQDDLEELNWCLGEISGLSEIEHEISNQVDNSRIPNVRAKLAELRDLRHDLQKLKVRQHEIMKIVAAREDQKKAEAARYAPLPVDQALKQKEIRATFKNIQELTGEAEKRVLELRTDLSSQGTNGNDRLTKKPTVENVMNTIMKMTNMVEQRSGDIDVLEAKMRKLRIPIAIPKGSRENSPFATSVSRSSPDQADALSKSMGGLRLSISRNGTPKKGSSAVSTAEIERYRTKVQQRKAMNALVKQVFKGEKPVVRGLD
ncbi:MAG: hypothetical protein L6R38_007879 [Xanthoria sp. 2 TBL-2021]|nr:MAG: hypothetical protein L6R38_007879 [Xanthoria sp. 2 TBL-2021]